MDKYTMASIGVLLIATSVLCHITEYTMHTTDQNNKTKNLKNHLNSSYFMKILSKQNKNYARAK